MGVVLVAAWCVPVVMAEGGAGASGSVPITRPGEGMGGGTPGGGEARPLFCSRCGAGLLPDARFCSQCGAPVERTSDSGAALGSGGAAAALAAGHRAVEQGEWGEVVAHYRRAIAADPGLRRDARLLENLVRALAYRLARADAEELITAIGEPVVPYLRRAQEAGGGHYYLRHNAARMLEKLGLEGDWVTVYIQDLRYCTDEGRYEDRDEERRERAAEMLGKLCDRRAIPQLRASARDDDDWSVRRRCKRALEHCFGIEL
jgi:hypothetical protein